MWVTREKSKGVEMLRRRQPVAKFVLLALVGLCICASEGFAQKAREAFEYAPPSLSLTADRAVINLCEGQTAGSSVRLNASAVSPDGNGIRYKWTTNAGQIDGNGAVVNWDLAGARPGVYRAFLEINTGKGDEACEAFASTAVLVKCPPPPPPVCTSLLINCPDRAELGQPVTFTSAVTGIGNATPTYNWAVSAGTIIEGQGTKSIKVDTTGLGGQTIRATLAMGGFNLECSASCAVPIPPPPPTCRKFDEFPELSRNDEKARLDNFMIELQNDPTSRGYVIVHPGAGAKPANVTGRSTRIVDYLVNSRRFDSGRLMTLVGPARSEMLVELWVCPQGSNPPTAAP
ncbi:MAG: hypothetical protein ACRD8U_06775 [Pyrinomonadaceae bacterium]